MIGQPTIRLDLMLLISLVLLLLSYPDPSMRLCKQVVTRKGPSTWNVLMAEYIKMLAAIIEQRKAVVRTHPLPRITGLSRCFFNSRIANEGSTSHFMIILTNNNTPNE